jgi:hypothetical protein
LKRDRAEDNPRIKLLERWLVQDKTNNTESRDAKEQLEKTKKQWADMGGMYNIDFSKNFLCMTEV